MMINVIYFFMNFINITNNDTVYKYIFSSFLSFRKCYLPENYVIIKSCSVMQKDSSKSCCKFNINING